MILAERLAEYDFSKEKIKNIVAIYSELKKSGHATEHYSFCESGGGFTHFYFQLKSERWVWFHNITGDITISEPFKTSELVYNAFWEDSGVNVNSLALRNYTCNGDGVFAPYSSIVMDIMEEDFYNIYEEK